MSWLEEIIKANHSFLRNVNIDSLPKLRQPCPFAVVTCMDPRINLEAAGIPAFKPDGVLQSQVRVIRTIGGMAEDRSLVIGIHLAGFKEIAVVMHTDCGCSLAYHNVEKILKNMETSLGPEKMAALKNRIGEPFRDNLLAWLYAFEDPKEAVKNEVERIKNASFTPGSLIVHGLVYDLASGKMDIIINDYQA